MGRLARRRVGAGRVAFSLALDAAGRRALGRVRALALTVRVVLTPPHGRAVVRSGAVTLRR